jgi:hypothetical protein
LREWTRYGSRETIQKVMAIIQTINDVYLEMGCIKVVTIIHTKYDVSFDMSHITGWKQKRRIILSMQF